MPRFRVLRCDPDRAMILLRKYFSDMGVFLQIKRGPTHLNLLDAYVKHLKTKIISYLKIHPQADFPEVLAAAVKSYNETYQNVLKGSPASVNSNYFDPLLRERLHKHHPKLQPFETWYKNQLFLQKRVLEPRKGPPKSRDDFRINDLVMLTDYPVTTKLTKRNWSRRTKLALYRVERVDTSQKPFRWVQCWVWNSSIQSLHQIIV